MGSIYTINVGVMDVDALKSKSERGGHDNKLSLVTALVSNLK